MDIFLFFDIFVKVMFHMRGQGKAAVVQQTQTKMNPEDKIEHECLDELIQKAKSLGTILTIYVLHHSDNTQHNLLI